jgi:hypothetical protein
MPGKNTQRISHPVYRTVFSVTEELYESKTAKEPLFSRTVRGNLRIDLVRALCVGTAVLSAIAVVGLLAGDRKK